MFPPSHIHNRFLSLLHSYFLHPASLLSILDENDSVIGHTFALDVIFGLNVHDDLRIYTPRGCQPDFRYFLHNMGYISQAKVVEKGTDNSLTTLGLRDTEHWTHGSSGRHVLLLQSNSACSRHPIFSSPCSALMNYLTGHSYVAAYPKSTEMKYMLLNTKAFASPECPILPTLLQGDIANLETVGFRTRYSSIQWDRWGHVCSTTAECPQTIRSEDDEETEIGDFPHTDDVAFPRSGTVQWSLGGPMCSPDGVVSIAMLDVIYE